MGIASKNIINEVQHLLLENRVDIFLGYRELDGHTIHHGYTRDNLDELGGLCISQNRYPLEKAATRLAKKAPNLRIGLIARDCNQRSLNVLYSWNQLDPDNIETIGCELLPLSVQGPWGLHLP